MSAPPTTLPAPVATRLRRPGWRDPRLLVGVAIVAVSVALGSWVVRSASQTVGVYAAARTLAVGEPVTVERLQVVQVRGVDTDRYLLADGRLPDGAVLLRSVGAGELVPASAVGDPTDLSVRSVSVPLGSRPVESVPVGSHVDLWFTPAGDAPSGPSGAPHAVVSGVEVARVDKGAGYGSAAGIEVLVDVDDLPAVLAALGSDGSVDVLPVPGAGR
ncbi:hypothetical protein [Cellulomonas citrea]|uniref:hypothetical protein n=1 Tax=Cellulomonas citrea TaxID=1909423 RepID=UPI00135C4683|nr:hypothetical protein [Cellulomonas citrea]